MTSNYVLDLDCFRALITYQQIIHGIGSTSKTILLQKKKKKKDTMSWLEHDTCKNNEKKVVNEYKKWTSRVKTSTREQIYIVYIY